MLGQYTWPGNVRELKNVIAQACILAERGLVEPEHLPPRIVESAEYTAPLWPEPAPERVHVPHNGGGGTPAEARTIGYDGMAPSPEGVFFPVGASLEDVQKAYTLKTLQHCGNNKTRAAKTLKVSRKTLYDKLLRWGVMSRTPSG